MILGFEEWATQAQLVEHGGFEQLSGCVLAIEAEHYITTILASPSSREPLPPALGGIPFMIETQVANQIDEFRKHNVTPFFIFSGLSFNGQETKLRRALQHAKKINNAWDLYNDSDPDRAVAAFGSSCKIMSWGLCSTVVKLIFHR